MARKVLPGFVLVVASLTLAASLIGIGAVWIYRGPVTREAIGRLERLDAELAEAQSALDRAETELRRALRILAGAQAALEGLSRSVGQAQTTLRGIGDALDTRVIPGLQTASDNLDQLQDALQGVLAALQAINSVSVFPVPIPGEAWLTDLVGATDSLNSEVEAIQTIAEQASTFISDVGYVIGGDFDETRQGFERLLEVVSAYRTRITAWRGQVADLIAGLPATVDRAAWVASLTLLWLGLSQASLALHALEAYRGGDPLAALRRRGSLPAAAAEDGASC